MSLTRVLGRETPPKKTTSRPKTSKIWFVAGAVLLIVALGPSIAAGWITSHPGAVHSPKAPPANFGPGWNAHAPSGIETWAIAPSRVRAPVIVMVHGYRQSRSNLRELAQHLHDRGYGIVLVELPYLDGSEPYSGGGAEAEALCRVIGWSKDKFNTNVVVAGYSAGGFASSLAVRNGCDVSALITDSAFVDAATAFRHASSQRTKLPNVAFFALRPAYFLATAGGELSDVRQATRRWSTPTLIIHGTADNYVPVDNADQLQTITGGEIWLVAGADHGGAWYMGASEYEQRADSFIREALGAKNDW